RLFREFAITLSIAIAVSALLSLSLTAMMCAHVLKPHDRRAQHGVLYRFSEKVFDGMLAVYDAGLKVVLRHKFTTLLVTIATLAGTGWVAVIVPKGFFPQQDTGLIMGVSEASADVSFPRMMTLQQALADEILKDPDVASVASFIGSDGTNATTNSGRFS